ncbi:MAG: ABC-ATPase domain-containing protein [Blautia sp.]|nr:ABC-ATPase domain-containing protein [Blautia sp.]
MKTAAQLREELRSIDHKSYPAYKSLKGEYRFTDYVLSIDHVQGDPFAAPSHVTVRFPMEKAGFPADYYKDRLSRTSLADYLLRQFGNAVAKLSFQARGSGKSGLIAVSRCGQEILDRSACCVTEKEICVRFSVGFPARGRTIDAKELDKILFELLPKGIPAAFLFQNQQKERLQAHMELREDQAALRMFLRENHLAAFVADGAVLPRESGVSAKPMKNAVVFKSPETLRVTAELPHKGKISGMGIPCGVTLIVGGGYHGKSTLLLALQNGVYDHIAGDGREYVVTDETALKLRAEDGRFIKDVDISLFINHLPNGKDTKCFCTEDASGSTSQAAGIVEGAEAGSRLFLLDEDTSAANFMVRDAFMQRVIAPEKEPITPFLERVRGLYEQAGISTILVAGSSGAFFHVADTVIQMDAYQPKDITEEVRGLCGEYPLADTAAARTGREKAVEAGIMAAASSHKRVMTKHEESKTRRNYYGDTVARPERMKTKVHGRDGFSLGHEEVDLKALEQLCDSEQTAALAYLLKMAYEGMIDRKKTLPEIVEILADRLAKEGTAVFREGGYVAGGFAIPRVQEIYGCFNRYRRP